MGQFQPILMGNMNGSWEFRFVQIKEVVPFGPNKCINIWHVTSFGYSLIKEFVWQKPVEQYRPIGPLVLKLWVTVI